jgi:hypothetical protein
MAIAAGPGLSLPASYGLATGILVVAIGILYFLLGRKEGGVARFWYGILGSDNRVSTSKVQFALWTVALSFALLVIVFHDAVFGSSTLDPRYLLLIGFPAGAAVSAKAITTGKQAGGTIDKTPQQAPTSSLQGAVKDVVSDDSGNLDLGDAQYFLFNIVALVAFFYAFAHHPTALPVLPDTLVGLTSASATAYVAKKAATSAPLSVTAVSPQKVHAGDQVTIYGSNLCGTPVAGALVLPSVTIGGVGVTILSDPSGTELVVQVDANTPTSAAQTLPIQVVTRGGQSTKFPNALEVDPPPVH